MRQASIRDIALVRDILYKAQPKVQTPRNSIRGTHFPNIFQVKRRPTEQVFFVNTTTRNILKSWDEVANDRLPAGDPKKVKPGELLPKATPVVVMDDEGPEAEAARELLQAAVDNITDEEREAAYDLLTSAPAPEATVSEEGTGEPSQEAEFSIEKLDAAFETENVLEALKNTAKQITAWAADQPKNILEIALKLETQHKKRKGVIAALTELLAKADGQ